MWLFGLVWIVYWLLRLWFMIACVDLFVAIVVWLFCWLSLFVWFRHWWLGLMVVCFRAYMVVWFICVFAAGFALCICDYILV